MLTRIGSVEEAWGFRILLGNQVTVLDVYLALVSQHIQLV
jgi:hypothetical protein